MVVMRSVDEHGLVTFLRPIFPNYRAPRPIYLTQVSLYGQRLLDLFWILNCDPTTYVETEGQVKNKSHTVVVWLF